MEVNVRNFNSEDIDSIDKNLLIKLDSFKKRRFTKEQVLRMKVIKKEFIEKHW